MRPRGNARDGVAYVEFLIVILPFLVLFTGIVQLGLIYGAGLLVEAAAHLAVRSAVVVMPDDREDYPGAGPNEVGPGSGLEAYRNAPSGSRLAVVRRAAAVALAPLGSVPGAVARFLAGTNDLHDALEPGGVADALAAAVGAVPAAVTFPDPNGGYRTHFGPASTITARVTYLFPCLVPIAAGVACRSWGDLDPDRRAELETLGAAVSGLAASRGRFQAIAAEASMKNQGVAP